MGLDIRLHGGVITDYLDAQVTHVVFNEQLVRLHAFASNKSNKVLHNNVGGDFGLKVTKLKYLSFVV